ncbi:unnamed protein product, partial [Meganyctiphanes norvegica]
ITICNTINGNTASTNTKDMKILAPKILASAPINWKSVAEAQPTCLSQEVIPRKCKNLFQRNRNVNPTSNPDTHNSITESSEALSNTSSSSQATHGYNLRTRSRNAT